MDIIVNKEYKCIAPFKATDLPGFIVLTGENGTGKTQLLEYIYAASSFNEDGISSIDPEQLINSDLFMTNMIEQIVSPEDGTVSVVFPAEILINGSRARNVVYRGVDTPNVDVGNGYNLENVYLEGERLAQKHLFVHNHQQDIKDVSKLTSTFNRVLQVVKPSGFQAREMKIPEITLRDIDIINRIEKEFPLAFAKDPFYYISLQNPPQSQVFSANIRFMFYQYWAREKAGLHPLVKPWVEINDVGRELGFRYEIVEPRLDDQRFEVKLRDKIRGVFVSPNALSSGEKVLFSLLIALFSARSMSFKPEVILFDEPDAYLHPSLTATMLHVLHDVFVQRFGMQIILTTHSPSTVALSPEQSVFTMDSGAMKKTSKKDAILSLTCGLNTLAIYYENNKQVFVEAKNDAMALSNVFHIAQQQKEWLKTNDIQLHFINVGEESGDGGCSEVKNIVSDLCKAGNQTVYGLIDWDKKNAPKDRIFVLGRGNRYALDNYLMDPISVSLLFLEESVEKQKIGFAADDAIVSFGSKTVNEIQSIIDSIVTQLSSSIPPELRSDSTSIEYSTMDGRLFRLPKWFLIVRGHDLVDYYKCAFPFLNKYKSEASLYRKVLDVSYANYPGIIPKDIVDSLIDLQSA